jgi:hypothetical protein
VGGTPPAVAMVHDVPVQTINAPTGATANPPAQFRLHVVPPFPGAHVPPAIWPMAVPVMALVASHGLRPAHTGQVLSGSGAGSGSGVVGTGSGAGSGSGENVESLHATAINSARYRFPAGLQLAVLNASA